jgi:hypothetical protein
MRRIPGSSDKIRSKHFRSDPKSRRIAALQQSAGLGQLAEERVAAK